MTDIALIESTLSSIKTAFDIAKLFKESSASLEKAETELRIAQLTEALAEAKIKLTLSVTVKYFPLSRQKVKKIRWNLKDYSDNQPVN